MQNVHLRGVDAEDAISAIEQRLEQEGFELLDAEDAPPENQPGIRRLAIYEDEDTGWVGVADDPFARTNWGEVLSYALEVPVFTLAGEADHAFYSHVFVHENGEEKHASKIPGAEKHGADGRYRISPTFLKAYFPDANVDGIVVEKVGGEGNMRAVAEAVGIPKPLFSIHDDEDDAYAILTFRFAGDESSPDMGAFESELGDLASLLGGGMGGMDMSSLMKQMTGSIMKNMMGEVDGFEVSPTSSTEEGNLGQELNVHRTFTLGGEESAKGLTITVSGSGLALFDPPEMTAEKFDATVTAKAEVVGDTRVFRFPDVELVPKKPTEDENLPLAEQLRQQMQRLRSMEMFQNSGAVTVRFMGLPAKMGKGHYVIEGALDNGLAERTEVELTVGEAFDVPLLPGKGDISPHYAKAYSGRDFAVGWIAFDAWTPLLLALGKELVETCGDTFSVNVTRKGGEHLEFDAIDWSKLTPELERGADVQLGAGDLFRGTRIEISHAPEGPNIFAGQMEPNERRPPKASLTWSIPKRKDPAPLAAWAESALTRAGADADVVGGVATAQGEPMQSGSADFPYEHLAKTRLEAYDVRWQKEHVRSPGWRVLAPSVAAVAPVDGVGVVELAHAKLLRSSAANPFAYGKDDATAMERAVLPAVGTPRSDE